MTRFKEKWMFSKMEQFHVDKIGLFLQNKGVQKLKLLKNVKPKIQ
jgi:hypothetical protein